MEKILITGGSGYQASFIINRLKEKYEITLTDRIEPKEEYNDLKFIKGDITIFDDVKKACTGQDAVVHLVALVRERAGMPHTSFADVMVKGVWNVAEACVQCGVNKLVNISSVCAGWPSDTSKPYLVGEPAGFGGADMFYGMSKHLGEEITRIYHQGRGLAVINLRPVMIAGDGSNAEPSKPVNASPYWFLHVHPEDVAQAVGLAIENREIGFGTFHVASNHPASLFDIKETKLKLGYQPKHNWEDLK